MRCIWRQRILTTPSALRRSGIRTTDDEDDEGDVVPVLETADDDEEAEEDENRGSNATPSTTSGTCRRRGCSGWLPISCVAAAVAAVAVRVFAGAV